MAVTVANIELWMQRGETLGCMPNRLEQARYMAAWDEGDTRRVLAALERVLVRSHRMPAINWLNRPDVLRALDQVHDAPPSLPEDWRDADFAVVHPSGRVLHPSWLEGPGAWDELLAAETAAFLFARVDARIAAAKRWAADALAARMRPATLAELSLLATRVSLLALAAPASPVLQAVVGPGWAALSAEADALRARALALLGAWRSVTQPRTDGPRLITLQALRSCEHVFQVDALLAECTSARTANLMTYLRCADAPANQ